MPTLHGYEVRTYWLSTHEEIDVLRAEDLSVWVPGPQVAVLSGDGRRSDGRYSTSDVGRVLDKAYVRREPDPHKLYTRTRVRSTTLFSLEGLVQKTCRTTKSGYLVFCYDFIEHVLPNYQDIAARNAELIWFWNEALDHLDLTGKGPSEAGFRTAIALRDARLAGDPHAQPVLILGTAACEQVVYHNATTETLCLAPVTLSTTAPAPTVFPVGRLHDANDLAEIYRAQHRDGLSVGPQLALYYADNGAITLPDGTPIVAGAPTDPHPFQKPTQKTAPTAEEIREALRQLMRDELPGLVRPIVLDAIQEAVKPGVGQGEADLVKIMTGAVARLAEIAVINREQLELSRQTVDLVTPSHQMFCTASDYIEMDGVAEALKRAPRLAEPSLGLDCCPDHGKASLWMKKLCREENKKVAANAVARLVAEAKGEEVPPLYIPAYRMKRLEREHVKVLMFNPACWAKLKQTFLPADTPTLLFPGAARAQEA